MIIPVTNNLTIGAPKTWLASSLNSGVGTFAWKSPTGFNASWALQFGETSQAQTEIVILSSSTPSGTLGTTTANFAYDHPADTPIYGIKYDQVVFERSLIGTTGTATPITNGTVNIQANMGQTFFDDTTGSPSYAYRTYFNNSVSAITSTESDWQTLSGFSFYSLGKIKQRIKDKLISNSYLNGTQTSDSLISDWVNEWLEKMQNTAIGVNEDYLMGTMAIAYLSGVELGTITATDFKQLKRVWYGDSSGTYTATKMDSNSFSPNKTFSSTYPYFYMQGDSIIGRKPSDGSGTFFCEYYQLPTILVEDTDVLPVSMQGYSSSFVNYGHSQALFKDQKIEEAQAKLAEAESDLQRFKTDISPRNVTGATYMDIVEDTGADQELWL